jgi:hypothetical protein
MRALTDRFSRDNPAFPAQWFTAYFELSSVNQLVATVVSAMRKAHRRELGACMGAPGPHDFAVRVRIVRLRYVPRPPHPATRLVTFAIRPSIGRDNASNHQILKKRKRNIFGTRSGQAKSA